MLKYYVSWNHKSIEAIRFYVKHFLGNFYHNCIVEINENDRNNAQVIWADDVDSIIIFFDKFILSLITYLMIFIVVYIIINKKKSYNKSFILNIYTNFRYDDNLYPHSCCIYIYLFL